MHRSSEILQNDNVDGRAAAQFLWPRHIARRCHVHTYFPEMPIPGYVEFLP